MTTATSPRATRALIVCPGRGSYGKESLGSLRDRSPAAAAVIAAADALRTAAGRPTVSELDALDRHSAARHVAGEHASLLTATASLADLADLGPHVEIVGVCGNSMGWYTALVAAGALSLHDGLRLIETMGSYQANNVIGGQLLYPITHPDWTPDPERRARVEAALAAARTAGHAAGWSIDLGSFAVLGADDAGLAAITAALPPEARGAQTFPVRLPLHSAFHTALMGPTSDRARAELADLDFRAPRVPLIDGRGVVFRPWSADPAALADYTLGHQVTDPYDFARGLRAALHHTAPDVVVLLGPGNSLGGPSAATLVHAHWHGAETRAAFEAETARAPMLLSFAVPEQRARLVQA
jgi:[acyl-carrier-protein] S-malonyltransferase